MTSLNTKEILQLDPWLEPFIPAIESRYSVFQKWKQNIVQSEGGYDAFSKGYLKFGLNVDKDGNVTYREWAPNAKEAYLIGDFSMSLSLRQVLYHQDLTAFSTLDDWNRSSHPMKRDEYGVWSITVPAKSPGVCAIPHESTLKVSPRDLLPLP
jgi:1,4-alpha-glucan branching enzyme